MTCLATSVCSVTIVGEKQRDVIVAVGWVVNCEVNFHKGKKRSRGGPKSVKVLPREKLDLV